MLLYMFKHIISFKTFENKQNKKKDNKHKQPKHRQQLQLYVH